MEKLLKYYLKVTLASLSLLPYACNSQEFAFTKKEFSEAEKLVLAEQLLSSAYYSQGSVGEQALIEEAVIYNNKHPNVWRIPGISFLKRGIPTEVYERYRKCVELDPINWQGYRGYCYLYFYRDYKRALKDFDELDVLTPDFLDYPQATSIDYMRAICYYGLNQPQKALEYIDKHIATETKTVGINYIGSVSFIIKGKAHEMLGQLSEATKAYETGLAANEKNADAAFYLAQRYSQDGKRAKAKELITMAKQNFMAGYSNSRPYVEEFFQVYLADIEELEMELGKD